MYNTYGAYDYTASFFTTTFKTLASGQEEKVQTPIYENIKVKLRFLKNSTSQNGADEVFINSYKVITPPEYNGANKGDMVRINGEDYTIDRKIEKRHSNTIISVNYYVSLL